MVVRGLVASIRARRSFEGDRDESARQAGWAQHAPKYLGRLLIRNAPGGALHNGAGTKPAL